MKAIAIYSKKTLFSYIKENGENKNCLVLGHTEPEAVEKRCFHVAAYDQLGGVEKLQTVEYITAKRKRITMEHLPVESYKIWFPRKLHRANQRKLLIISA